MLQGTVLNIFIASSAGEPMEEVLEVQSIANAGLSGDRYAEGIGSWSKTKVGQRDISLISQEAIQRAERVHGVRFEPIETRRNLLVTLSIEELNALVGKQFFIGGILMRGTELCTPCKRPSQLCGKKGFEKAFVNSGGLRASILSDGIIMEGEEIISPD